MNWVKIVDQNHKIWMFNLHTISQVNEEDDGTWMIYATNGVRIVPDEVASKLADFIISQVPGPNFCPPLSHQG